MGKTLSLLRSTTVFLGLLGIFAGCTKPSASTDVSVDHTRYNTGQISFSFAPAFSTSTHILLTQSEAGRVVARIYHREPSEAQMEWLLDQELELSSAEFAALMEAFESPEFVRAAEADYGVVLDGATFAFRKELGKRVVTVEVKSPWSRAEGVPIILLAQQFGDAVGLGPYWPIRLETQN